MLHATFAARPEYLASTEGAVDLKDFGPALGRRFRALKLWFVLRMYGAEGLRAAIREHVRLAQLFAAWVAAEPGWEVVAPHPFSTVCFRHAGRDNFELARAATATGEVFVAATTLRGADAIRLAIGNGATTEADVRQGVGGAARMRAVIFDLWETLIDWDQEAAARMVDRIDALSGPGLSRALVRGAQPLHSRPCEPCWPRSGVPAEVMDEVCEVRLDFVRHCLVPRAGAVETLRELRRRGHPVGLITVCSAGRRDAVAGFAVRRAVRRRGLLVADRDLEARPADLPPLLRAARRRAVGGGVRRRRRERRARRRAAGRDGRDPHPQAGRGAPVAGGPRLAGPRVTSIPGVLDLVVASRSTRSDEVRRAC